MIYTDMVNLVCGRDEKHPAQGFHNGFAKFPVKMLKNPFFWKNFPAKIT
jgi:hypothetical protein